MGVPTDANQITKNQRLFEINQYVRAIYRGPTSVKNDTFIRIPRQDPAAPRVQEVTRIRPIRISTDGRRPHGMFHSPFAADEEGAGHNQERRRIAATADIELLSADTN
jgi:hypothetical protein